MIIYRITSLINNKIYLGQTIGKLSNRKGIHLFHLRNNKHSNSYLQNCFNKYGECNLKFDIIDTAKSLNELNFKEKNLISIYKTNNRKFGFNIREGGNNETMSKKTKKLISEKLLGNTNGRFNKGKTRKRNFILIHSKKTKELISKKLKNRKLSKEHIENSRIAHCKKVRQYDLNNNYIETYNSLVEAAKISGANKSVISLCLSGKKKTSGGYKWKFE